MSRRKASTRRTKHKTRKSVREKGKISFTKFFAEYKIGDKVALKVDSSYQKGRYHPRFHGKICEVTGKKGRCYILEINDQGKKKSLIVHPVHLLRR